MNYYKIIKDTSFIGVATSKNFRKYQKKNRILLNCKEKQGQYIQLGDDSFYRDDWMISVSTEAISYETANIISIEKEEYDMLYQAIESNEEIILEQLEPPVEEEPINPIKEATIELIRKSKIAEMNSICKKTITNGFDVILSDGKTHHFSLEITDQLNILKLYNKALIQDTFLPYHADGEPYEILSPSDVFTIYNKMDEIINYHTIYYNSLKNYMLALKSEEEIKKVKYGIKIPIEYQSEVLKGLIGG